MSTPKDNETDAANPQPKTTPPSDDKPDLPKEIPDFPVPTDPGVDN